jgi:aspartate/methionine/tyrosine aminotransferase
MYQALTQIELEGLKTDYNLADGHAYHDLLPSQTRIIAQSSALWQHACHMSHERAQKEFLNAFLQLANIDSLVGYPHYVICPTASNSIDIVAAFLSCKGYSTILLEPTFDNLSLLLKRRGVKIGAICEDDLHFNSIQHCLDGKKADALFIVNPNNPTGRRISHDKWEEIIEYAKHCKLTLILDNTFRFFVSCEFDIYQSLLDSGVSFLGIEDTGKVWSTLDMKASLLFFSADMAAAINTLYQEFYLCHSNFILGLLTQFLKDSKIQGLTNTLWADVAKRRHAFRQSIEGSILTIVSDSSHSTLSIEWCEINSPYITDEQLVSRLKRHGLMALPGHFFFWQQGKFGAPRCYLRFSLLKPNKYYYPAINRLRQCLGEL